MTIKVQLKDFRQDYLPFEFQGFWNPGNCFLRILIKNQRIVILCTQLPNYTGTSITNAVESVIEHAARKLHGEKDKVGQNIVTYKEKFSLIRSLLLGEKKNNERLIASLLEHLLSKSIWIEHYPPGEGLLHEGSYSRVSFTEAGEPIWNYLSPEKLSKELATPDLFDIDYEELKEWHTGKY